MATQSEIDAQSRKSQANSGTSADAEQPRRSVDVETHIEQPEPFSEADPFRSARIAETVSETGTFLEAIQASPSGFQDLDESEFRSISRDVAERAKWSEARKDGFIGVLRLALPTPPRSKRVL